MPRLDPYTSQVKLDGTRNITATADAFGGQTAKAIGGAGEAIGEVADAVNRVDEAKSRMRAANFLTQADLNWRQQMIERENDPEFATKYGEDGSQYAGAFKTDFQEYATKAIGEADRRDRKYVQQGMYNLGESLMGDAMNYQAKMGAEFAVDTLKKSVDNATISAKLSPNQYSSIMANTAMVVSQAVHIDPTTRRRIFDTATQDITQSAAMGMLEKGGVPVANKILNGTLTFSMPDKDGKMVSQPLKNIVDAHTFEALSDQAHTTIKRAESVANDIRADKKSDIDTMIDMAETPDDFMAASDAIKDNSSIFKHTELNDMRVKLYKKSKDLRDDMDSVTRGSAFATGDQYLNPANSDHVKDFNNYYRKSVEPVLADMQPDERNTYLANMVNAAKVIPDDLKGDIKVAARSQNATQITQFSDFVDRLRNANPQLLQDIDQQDLGRIDMVNAKIASGLKPEEAISQVDQVLDPNNKAVVDNRTSALKDLKINYRSKAISNFSGMFSRVDQVSNFASRQIAQLESDYRQAYETQYKITGDTSASEKYANQMVTGTYGVTDINGTNQVMRNPPEKYYGVNNVDNSWMRDQVHEEAAKILGNSMVSEGTTVKDIILTPMPFYTPRGAEAGRPGYKLFLKGKDGTLIDMLGVDKESGRPNLFYFDTARKKADLVGAAKKGGDPNAMIPGEGF